MSDANPINRGRPASPPAPGAGDPRGPSAFYPLITAAAKRTGLPWWLLYGVMEQESGFDPKAESGRGALGLMQLMPATFPAWARTSLLDPVNNVKLGAGFLDACIEQWKQETPDEAIKFGLASYNGGAAYVLQAQLRALEAGADGHCWCEIEPFLYDVVVKGKRPDVGQISGYVRTIWQKFAARRGSPPPEGAAA